MRWSWVVALLALPGCELMFGAQEVDDLEIHIIAEASDDGCIVEARSYTATRENQVGAPKEPEKGLLK